MNITSINSSASDIVHLASPPLGPPRDEIPSSPGVGVSGWCSGWGEDSPDCGADRVQMLSAPMKYVHSSLSSPSLHAASAPSRAFIRSYRIATGIMNSPEPSSFPEALALIAPISTEDVAALPSTSTAQAQALSPSPFQCPGSRLQGRTGVPRPLRLDVGVY